MTQADIVLTNAVVVAMNPASDVFAPGAVATGANLILGVGPAHEISARYQARHSVDCSGRAKSPA